MAQLIDPDMPGSAAARSGFDGLPYELIFSDDFNTANRTFWPGDDPFWEAVNIKYGSTGDQEHGRMHGRWVILHVRDAVRLQAVYGLTPMTCDVGTFPNQAERDGSWPAAALQPNALKTKYNYELSWLPWQRLSEVIPDFFSSICFVFAPPYGRICPLSTLNIGRARQAHRNVAVIALSKLYGSEDPSDAEGEPTALEVLLETLSCDPVADVRRVALLNIPLSSATLDAALGRTRDIDTIMHKLTEFIIRNGKWVDVAREDVKNEESKTVEDNVLALLSLFDLTESTVAEDALLCVWNRRADISDHVEFNDAYWANLTPERAFFARVFVDHCIAIKNAEKLDASFDAASMYTDRDPEIVLFLLLIEEIAFFNADRYDETNLLLKELAASRPNADTLACRVVQAYLRVQPGIKALDGARHDEAADHFTATLDCRDSSSKLNIHKIYEDSVMLTTSLLSLNRFINKRKSTLAKHNADLWYGEIDVGTPKHLQAFVGL
ncbi:beta-glucan synthesis-associated protein-domain-containing protein [Suillus tomentosus]|nr:beta-glucan synthesis-associated protein-domain-containing protein [Suillus tomentosus]